jgi:glutamate racemase
MSDSRAIGVFDSGLGGLTVVRELVRLMPNERIIYLGDTARVPYGGRSHDTIRQYGLQDARVLMEMDIKLLIVACNTVSSVALDYLEQHIKDIPVIGVVLPGAKAAVLRTEEKKVGVIGTMATVGSGSYAKAIQDIDPSIKVYGKACPLFVPLVEEGLLDHDITKLTVQYYLKELIDLGVDCLVLGCTHYPLLTGLFAAALPGVALISSGEEAAAALGGLIHQAKPARTGSLRFFVSDDTEGFSGQAKLFLQRDIAPAAEFVDLDEIMV